MALLLVPACTEDSDITPLVLGADVIKFTQDGLYPEGVQYDTQRKRFLVSSETRGTIGQVQDDGKGNGTYQPFAADQRLISTVGLKLDATRNRLLAAVSDPGYNTAFSTAATKGKLAALAVIDLNGGAVASYVNLSNLRPTDAGHFANDVAVDNAGAAYVTDSFAPVIYRVGFATDGTPTANVLVENPQFQAPAGAFGLNGIVFHPDGYLLVAKSNDGTLYKVTLTSPATVTKVTTSTSLVGADGLLLQDNSTLLVVTNSQSKVYRLTTSDNWANAASNASATTTAGVYPTTLTKRSSTETYVLYSHLNALQSGQTPAVTEFTINKISF
ncbi:gluconolaconase [Hymenobacter jejuensis]|uniref:Gluconolaconase n=1 Tax=Hymenobacter jejuensis TaxID=2502781 RepID=A0A5B8A425_9BACT|nr:gluconolaconase [Hymenobacter jejuensis]QDA61333.1 gluconolaconase [Hymenobacter jejuensis]